jgi:hypothetical protein
MTAVTSNATSVTPSTNPTASSRWFASSFVRGTGAVAVVTAPA